MFCLASAIYIPSQGGTGINLGYNLFFLLILGMVLLLIASKWQRANRTSDNQTLILLGAVCVSVPWSLEMGNSPGCLILLLAFLGWWLMRDCYFSDKLKEQILSGIFLLSIIQTVISTVQVFLPEIALKVYEYSWLRNHGLPYGIFQQVNLLASFLATGIGCGFLLLLKNKRTRLFILANIMALTGIMFILAINQSRAGMLGALTVVSALTMLYGKQQKIKVACAVLLMATGLAAGFWVVHHTHVMINGSMIHMARGFESSNQARIHLLVTTLKMIALKPWSGWGYGTFEYEFSRFVISHRDPNYPFPGVTTHPHNELLFAWFQGGLVAVAGMLLLVCGWLKNIIVALRNNNGTAGYTFLILPLVIHLNLEYPFYQSFIHLGVFVLLLRLGEQDVPSKVEQRKVFNKLITVFLGLGLVVYSLLALLTHHQLTQYERNGYADFPVKIPWYFVTQNERSHYDAMVALLIDYNKTRNKADLAEFMTRAKMYSLKHNDKNIWLSMISITHHLGDQREADYMQNQYNDIFPKG